jgi:hypothetical protein
MAETERWMKAFLAGCSFDFALALAERVPAPVFVAVGNPGFPEHVGLRIGDCYADVRGLVTCQEFVAHCTRKVIAEISRQDVEFHCGLGGMVPPYRGIKDIAAARRAVRKAFPHGIPSHLPAGGT